MCKQNKLEMAGQKKKFSLREAVDPEATTDIRALGDTHKMQQMLKVTL